MAQIVLNIEKRYALLILAGMLALVGVIGAVAYGGTNPGNLGHTVGELAGFPDCNAGQALRHNGGSWSCVAVGSSGSGVTCSWIQTSSRDHPVVDFENNGGTGLCKARDGYYGNVASTGEQPDDPVSCYSGKSSQAQGAFQYYACQ
tara:strand:+ start:2452 stop:2889 length:438 start_codon:yes stop_codon:yes gene_type:complete